jgi:hypothetical protein
MPTAGVPAVVRKLRFLFSIRKSLSVFSSRRVGLIAMSALRNIGLKIRNVALYGAKIRRAMSTRDDRS